MQYITTTELRTKSNKVVKTLKEGGKLSLIYRSRVIGEILPYQEPQPLTRKDIEEIKISAQKLDLPKLSYKERAKRYRTHIMKQYGQGVS